MTYHQIDILFPFVVFGYGLVMTLTLNTPVLMDLAEKRCPPPLLVQFRAHRYLGVFSLVLGGLWSLQNVWFS